MKTRPEFIFALVVILARPSRAQSPLSGFWILRSKECVPTPAPCRFIAQIRPSDQYVIEVHGNNLTIGAPTNPSVPLSPPPVDTIWIDGAIVRWTAGHRGIESRWH